MSQESRLTPGDIAQRFRARINELNQASPSTRLAWLQRALPLSIVFSVLIYEIILELFLTERLPAWVRFGLDNLIFGVFGASVTLLVLEWILRHIEAEERLQSLARAQERQLAAITTNSADAIIFLDNDGIIQSWNRGAEFVLGYRADEVVGKHFSVLLPEALRTQGEVEFLNRELGKQGFIRGYVTQRLTKDGRIIHVELTRTLLRDEHGQVIGSSAILRDVTEREQVQAQIRDLNRQLEAQIAERTRELSEANRELRKRQRELEVANAELQKLDDLKSEFVSMVSHELRAPLANISGVFELLLEEDPNPLAENQREFLLIANSQVERLKRLVTGILNVSRIEAGQMECSPQAFDIIDLIERTCNQWSASDPTHRYIAPRTRNLPSVWADRDWVEVVLTNLLDNAKKYSPEGTKIRVEARVKDNQVVVAVSDQGEGIDAKDLPGIFDKFTRIERGDARQTYGQGLGLYISQKFIETMNGRLWVDSKRGHGSTFSFSLPLAGHSEMEEERALNSTA